MAAVQKKNNMKKRPFKLRSGNKPSMAKIAGVSPMRQEKKAMISSDLKPNSEKRIAEIRKKIKEGVGPDGYDMSDKEHQRLVMELKKLMMQGAKKTKKTTGQDDPRFRGNYDEVD